MSTSKVKDFGWLISIIVQIIICAACFGGAFVKIDSNTDGIQENKDAIKSVSEKTEKANSEILKTQSQMAKDISVLLERTAWLKDQRAQADKKDNGI